ncbi:hypothetical protein [Enterococcus faecalis]|uniref:hypothetical protein n=1 Tax=Enterococcus faecalis TaxID=1351 RepID=UPI0029370D3F|nr:hypothetical protein [Enterococcus faecalis]
MLNHQLCLEKSVGSNKQITEGFTIEWGVIVFDQFISLIVALLFAGVVITIVSYWLNKNDDN